LFGGGGYKGGETVSHIKKNYPLSINQKTASPNGIIIHTLTFTKCL